MILRYGVKTGLVNLIGEFIEQKPIDGMAYIEVDKIPKWDSSSQHLYVKNDKIVAVDVNTDIE